MRRLAWAPFGVLALAQIAIPLTDVDNTVRQLGLLTVGIGLTTLLLVGVLCWFAVRRAFRPLTRIEDTAAAIAAYRPDCGSPDRSNSRMSSASSASLRGRASGAWSVASTQGTQARPDTSGPRSHRLAT